MATKSLKVDELRLDLENPRIAEASSQRDALQKIIDDQDVKLAALAESIVESGLNPMDRLLVIASTEQVGKFVVIEGNRRLAAIKILQNPTVLTGLSVRQSVQKRLESLAEAFDIKTVEPLDCFEVADRAVGTAWIQQRHTGENGGQGIVNWGGVATRRFRGTDPALQALDFVLQQGELTEEEKTEIQDGFPITTLDRLLSTPAVREAIGVEIKSGSLLTGLPLEEAIRPLLRIVRDLASGKVTVTKLKLQGQMVEYVTGLGSDLPDLDKLSMTPKRLEDLTPSGGGTGGSGSSEDGGGSGGGGSSGGGSSGGRKPRTQVRRTLIPRQCSLRVTNSKVAEIEKELRKLPLADYRHAISVLLRVFLELSVDHYLTANHVDLDFAVPGGGKKWKDMTKKVEEAADHMISNGAPKNDLDGIRKGINSRNSPLFKDTLHNYVHNRFYSPTEADLTTAWDNAQPFFERLWA
jgi:uncharacterized membrane protein YgcG